MYSIQTRQIVFQDTKSIEHTIYLKDVLEKVQRLVMREKKHVLLKKHICKWQLIHQDQQISIGKVQEVAKCTTSRQDNAVATLGDRVASSQAIPIDLAK